MSERLAAVITTIQPPTDSARALVKRLREANATLIVAGDTKGPTSYDLEGTEFLSLQSQMELPYTSAQKLPTSHYTRKNLGYLHAIAGGATCIYETDDDNAPNEHWSPREQTCSAETVSSSSSWLNVYRLFSEELIWPRGFPLELIRDQATSGHAGGSSGQAEAPIQQGLADGSPDVDAAWRLILDRDIRFQRRSSVVLSEGVWCPFNSQSTWWWPVAFPLMYLPSFCSFRMTDIWRSFIAQRCVWALGRGVAFHPAEVFQQRNVHDLMRDFEDEIPGYRLNRTIADTLESLPLESGAEKIGENMLRCYERLTADGIFGQREPELVRAWLDDLSTLRANR